MKVLKGFGIFAIADIVVKAAENYTDLEREKLLITLENCSRKIKVIYLRIGNEARVVFLLHLNPLLGICSTEVLYAFILKFLLNSGLPNDIYLLFGGEFDHALDIDC